MLQRDAALVQRIAQKLSTCADPSRRHLEKKAAEEKERERQERRRKERKNRDAFMELLQRHAAEGLLVARMRWKVGCLHLYRHLKITAIVQLKWA